MRRVSTFLAAIALVLASLAVGVFTADLPFWRRALQLPLADADLYLPIATLGTQTAGAGAPPAVTSLDAGRLEKAALAARAAGARALLVMHRGSLQLERYFSADDTDSLLPAAVIARPVAAMALGIAVAEGHIASLEAPVGSYLPEWSGDDRGRITLRQLLEDTSGLETGGDALALLGRAPWNAPARVPALATSRGVRLLLGNDYESTALGFPLGHEPGGFHNVSPANTQLLAVILERATGMSYESFLDERLWLPLGAGPVEMQLDRKAGMPTAHCCWRARARDTLRVAALLANGGMHGQRQLLPVGWVTQMARPSRVSPESGLAIARVDLDGVAALYSEARGSAFWVIPERELVILSIGRGDGGGDPAAARLVLAALPPR